MLSHGSGNTHTQHTHTLHNTDIYADTLMCSGMEKLGLKLRFVSSCLRALVFNRHQCRFDKLREDLSLGNTSGLLW